MYKKIKPKISNEAKIMSSAIILGDTTIEKNVSVWYNATLRGDMASIYIGEGSNIQDNAVVHTDTNIPTKIGKYVTVGHSAIVHAATVEDYALIGMGAIILNKAEIGKYAMVAAGTLVPPGKVVPPKTLVMGSPMKIIRELTEKEIQENHNNALHYIKMAADYHDE